jgi:hypothetical protein
VDAYALEAWRKAVQLNAVSVCLRRYPVGHHDRQDACAAHSGQFRRLGRDVCDVRVLHSDGTVRRRDSQPLARSDLEVAGAGERRTTGTRSWPASWSRRRSSSAWA